MKALIAMAAALGILSGCGNGHDHSSHSHGEAKSEKTAEKVKDPVCGMSIEKSAAKGHEDHKGGHYFFCSEECHKKFKAAPDKYVK